LAVRRRFVLRTGLAAAAVLRKGPLLPVEAKPLFRPDVVRPQLAAFPLPGSVDAFRPKLGDWAELLASGNADRFKEQEILHDFLTDFFCELLGYLRPVDGGDRFTISREKHVEVDGKYADAVLGNFHASKEEFIVALEGKGPKDPLDRPFAGRRVSAVAQGYNYAINLPCDWIIVTSIRQTRLYFKGADQQTYERFETEKLAADDAQLKRFVFLLGAERVVPAVGRCHFYNLRQASEKIGRELTKEFYLRYADMRQDAFYHLIRDNAEIPRHDVLACTQKLLDRILFCAFSEQRGLLPGGTIRRAYEHRDPYAPRPIWENFRGLFRAINTGNAGLDIPAYNGGLFAEDALLDRLRIPDDVCGYFRDLSDYDYRPPHEAAADVGNGHALIDVEILGHIFEQSITDLERFRNELAGMAEPVGPEKHKTRRKKEGAFYTPAFITRYIVEQALGGALGDRFERLRQAHLNDAKGTARDALADPNVYQLDKLKKPQRDALIHFWESWQDELAGLRLLDPACGSGAFLIEAFAQLHAVYETSNDRLQELRGTRTLFDLDRQILQNNLYGVDLNEEAVEICRLSLWIKTAQRGKVLTSLDHTIRIGNSVVSDPTIHAQALDWQAAFPEVFKAGGFDVIVANPPYVRQEMLSPFKPYLEANYETFHGMADLYVYFYELGLRMLKQGGRLSYVVTNKWMKASYAEPLRRLFAEKAWMDSVVDFGHAKEIFRDADVFPSIIVARKPLNVPPPTLSRVCAIPREQLRIDDLSRQIESEGFDVPRDRLGANPWSLEPPGVAKLLERIRADCVPLIEFAGARTFRGVTTGFNDAFLVDTPTRDKLIAEHDSSAEVFKKYLRGQDVDRWFSEWVGEWMIFARRGIEIDLYPAVKRHLENYRVQLEPKPKDWSGTDWQGRKPGAYKWYELQDPMEFWREFEKPKIAYQEIQYHPCFSLDLEGMLANNKVSFIMTGDPYILGVLNSPAMWWHNWRYLPHMKDEALAPVGYMVQQLPMPNPTDELRMAVESVVRRLIETSRSTQTHRRAILDWLKVEHEIDKPSMKLQVPLTLDSDGFVAEVKKIRGKKKPLTLAALKSLRDEFARSIKPAQALAGEGLALEHRVSDLVNEAYGLTPADVAIMWKTAPPRMPIPRPKA
jgi:hypothetical protein